MPRDHASILALPGIRTALKQAWQDSRPGIVGGHEEGGFVVQEPTGELSVERWPKGEQDSIVVPPHSGCTFNGKVIVASFHTHPNAGPDYLQEPGETDRRALRDDADLKGASYVGEFVIAQLAIYLISSTGQVQQVGDAQAYFGEA